MKKVKLTKLMDAIIFMFHFCMPTSLTCNWTYVYSSLNGPPFSKEIYKIDFPLSRYPFVGVEEIKDLTLP